jgi:hypothetical protein
MIKKLKFLSLILFILAFTFKGTAFAQADSAIDSKSTQLPQVIFINHVRGEECCDAGSLENLQTQINTFTEQQLPAYFAIRYDALTDPSYQNTFQEISQTKNLHPAVMLEITPQLAKDAGVEYQGTPESWYLAHYAFLIGYTPQDRIKLVDTLFAKYNQVFGEYPQLTTAWMADTTTLNYLQEKYHTVAHQLAREQWGLDSYTLDGGPPHYPYLASKNWVFNPDFSDSENLLIIRHTVDDPLYTYGDNTSSYTSQPNDYNLGERDLDYFKKLVNQTLFDQPTPGFINLGLETSMSPKYQEEYQQQIAYIADLYQQNKITFPDLTALKDTYSQQPLTVRQGTDLINHQPQQVWWITTPNYRLRLRQNDQNLAITDLRLYDPEFTDPYNQNLALNKGYFNVPYLINAGLSYPGIASPSRVSRLLGIPAINTFESKPSYDLSPQSNFLSLSQQSGELAIELQNQKIILHDQTNNQNLEFELNNFYVPSNNNYSLNPNSNLPDQHPLKNTPHSIKWQVKQDDKTQNLIEVTWSKENQKYKFEFETQPQLLTTARETQYPFIFPEQRPRKVDTQQSQVYAHNRYAVAGRNPVRLVLVPKDEHGFPTQPENEPTVSGNPKPTLIYQRPESKDQTIKFIDISNNQPLTTEIKLDLDGVTLTTQIYFAPNCKQDPKYCLTHPRQAWWYLKSFVQDKMRLKLLGETQ